MKRTLLFICVLVSCGLACAQNVTPAHQLAETLFHYNPSPQVKAEREALGLPENDWFDHLKPSYDETFVLDSDPGKNITIARRSGSDWYLGLTTKEDAVEISVPLAFLGSETNRMYFAYIYTDGGDQMDTRTHILCQLLCVNSGQALKFALKSGGGAAVRLSPIEGMAYREIDAYNGQTL